MSNPPYTLGLDIGMASVGAALLLDGEILALHVRTFDKAETAKEGESLNKIRRDSRLTRRRIRRRAHRLLRLRRLFKRVGLVPDAMAETFSHHASSPWELRAEGLERLLGSAEWAAVLYHLVKHRGFQSNRKSEAKADEKAGQMLSGVSRNKALMAESGWRSVGEMAARDPAFEAAKRNKGGDYSHTFSRSDIADELVLLFSRQRDLGSTFAGLEIEQQAHALLMARKPTLSGDNLLKMIGKCTFEAAEYRAPKASYRAERFVWLGKLNNLKISFSGDTRPLTETERNQLINLPFSLAKLTFKQVRKVLGLPDHARFNLLSYRFDPKGKDPEDATFFEAKYFHKIRKAYEEAGLKLLWQRDQLDADRLDKLAYAITCFKDDTEARDWLSGQNIEQDVIEAVLEISFEQFVQLSQKALVKLLPFMEQGQRYDEAAISAGYHHSQPQMANERTRFLPAPDKSTIINPVVYRALNQARKLVNAIVREYGPPAAVHIELARDLSKPFDERKRIEREQKEFQEEKTKARNNYSEMFGADPNGQDLQKWRLYREQSGQCAYSQKAIDLNRLREDGYVEIDHALPYSRSFDDSQSNKVIVLTAENRNKGNRTPFEYLDGVNNSERWKYFEAWVQSTQSLRQAKKNRLLRRNFGVEEAGEFRDRNLNDTRYICREFKKMVEMHLAWHPQATGSERCVVLSGQLTSLLRARWGLIKVRADGDLHHALDAAVIAAANRKMIKRMADYAKRKELALVRDLHFDPESGEVLDLDAIRALEAHFPEPWPHFRQELLARLSPDPVTALHGLTDSEPETITPVRVSRAPTRRGLGQAHQETIRSIGKEGKLLQQSQSAIKTPLTSLSLKDLPNIVGADRDTRLIEVLRERLELFKDDGKKAFSEPIYKPSKDGKVAPLIRSVKLLSTQKSGTLVRGGVASNGGMLRVDVFTKAGRFFAVPVYVADSVRNELPNRAVVAFKPEEEWTVMDESYQFMFSLYPNDWLSVQLKDDVFQGYFSGLDRSTGAASLWVHDRNQSIGKDGLYRGIGIKTAKSLSKYHVDMLGRLHKVYQEERKPLNSTQSRG
jgi:CRISPR-associated endonuclease Csn1